MDEGKPEVYRTIESEDHGPHQLLPVTGGRYTTVFKGPPGSDVGDLHTDIQPVGSEDGRILLTVHSGWRPSDEQVAQLQAGAHVRLTLWAYPIPPTAVSIEAPVCGCHGAEMVWDEHDAGYYCRTQRSTDDPPLDPSQSVGEADVDPLDQAHKDFRPLRDKHAPGQ